MANNNYPNLTQAASKMVFGVILFMVIAAVAGGCMTTTIGSGLAGVKYSVLTGTDLEETYGEGLNIHPPWVNIIKYDVRVQEELEEITALSSEGLSISMDASIRWRPINSALPSLHTTYGTGYYAKLVQPELRSAAREIVGTP